MATPTLTPSSETSAIVLPETGTVGSVEAALPLGIYAGSTDFLSGAADQVAYVYQKLGGDTLNIEITENQVYSAYEDAVLEYSYILNLHQSKNVLSNMLGSSTGSFDHDGQIKSGESLSGSDIALKYPRFDFQYAKRVGADAATQAGLGGERNIYSASFDVVASKQDYDLQQIVSSSANTSTNDFYGKVGNKRIYVTKVYFKTPHAMWRFYGYYGGLNTVGNLASYGQFADDSQFEIIPAWQNKLQAMAFEDAIYTRNSHYSYEIKNNKIRLYPSPVNESPDKYFIEFYVYDSEPWEESAPDKISGIEGINNMNTLPFENLPYGNINSIGKQWIRRFALSVCKEMLGYARSKFASIPIPGDSVQLNGGDLITQGQQEQEKLREELKTILDELTYNKLMENDAAIVEQVGKIQTMSPIPIIVG